MTTTQDNAYRKRYALDRSRGITRTVPADRVRRHVEELLAATGASLRGLAEASGVSATVLSDIRRGRRSRVNRAVEAKILTVRPAQLLDGRDYAPGFVRNVGARRRIQALLALGHRHDDISAVMARHGVRIGSGNVLSQAGDWTTVATHRAVKAAYDALWDQPGPSAKTRGWAAKLGYVPPLAWDDDSIDDPAAQPATATAPPAASGPAALIEDVEDLAGQGETLAAAARRVGLKAVTLERRLHRVGRRDLIARLRQGERA